MKTYQVISLIFCLNIFSGCQTNPLDRDVGTPYQGGSFEILLPPSVTATVEPNQGFMIHHFRLPHSKKAMLGIYEGLRPQLFWEKEKGLKTIERSFASRPGIEGGEDLWGVDPNGKMARESVWKCQHTIKSDKDKDVRLPITLHLWYFGVTQEEQEIFDAMIDTIEMK